MVKRMTLVGLAMAWMISVPILAGGALAADDPVASEVAKRSAAGPPVAVTGTLGKPEDTEKLAAALGHWGVLLVRSANLNYFEK